MPWTVEEYNDHTVQVESNDVTEEELSDIEIAQNLFNEYDDPSDTDDDDDDDIADNTALMLNEKFGLNNKCVFNQLEAFHCVTSLPPDSMHDLMEGR